MEVWKDVPNYEGLYQVSNLGNVKSLERFAKHHHGDLRIVREKILSKNPVNRGYLSVKLSKNGKKKKGIIHQLVAMAFLGHVPNGNIMVVDHINNVNTDNRLENLQIITNRENTSKDRKGGTSQYIGVCWKKREKRWVSNISINKKLKNLGYFKNEIDAHNAYQKALKELLNESK
jgi:hypothetical protein